MNEAERIKTIRKMNTYRERAKGEHKKNKKLISALQRKNRELAKTIQRNSIQAICHKTDLCVHDVLKVKK